MPLHENPIHTPVREGAQAARERAKAALRATRLAGDSLLVMTLLLTVLFIAISPAARSKGHQLMDGSGSGCVHSGNAGRCGRRLHSVYQPIERQVGTFPPKVGASCRTV